MKTDDELAGVPFRPVEQGNGSSYSQHHSDHDLGAAPRLVTTTAPRHAGAEQDGVCDREILAEPFHADFATTSRFTGKPKNRHRRNPR
jgi:hypothetical protein